MKSVTLDTGVLPIDEISACCAKLQIALAISTVTDREIGDGDERTIGLIRAPEMLVLHDSRLDEARLGTEEDGERLELILRVIANGSFPGARKRKELTKGQLHQLRDALAFESHVTSGRDVS